MAAARGAGSSGLARGMEAEAGVRPLPGAGQQEPEDPAGPAPPPPHWGEGAPGSPAPPDRPPRHGAPPHRGEAMLESPAPRNGVSEPPPHGGEGAPVSPAPRDRPPRNRYWGEEMLDRPPRLWGEEMLDRPPRLWGEEMLDSPAPRGQRHNNGVSEPPRQPQHWGEGLLAPARGARCPPSGRRGEPPQRPSQRGGEKPEPAQAGNLPPKEPGEPPGAGEQALLAMLRAVASSPLPVRSQQKDEPDLTAEEKLGILRALYRDKPVVFLERFRRALRVEHLGCFAHLAARYEVRFYCDEVRRAGRAKAGRTRVRNKRYAALQQLIKGGEYFSDEQMRAREPLLYEQYIGQYLSEEELLALGSQAQAGPCSLSGVLMDSYQEQVLQLRLHIQQEQEHACMEEEEEEDDDEGEGSSSASDSWVPDTEEKAFLREEFTSRMHQRFLDGKDRDFDYSEVDENPEFDNLDIVTRDEEERYFDGEESEEAEEMEAE